MTTNYQNQFGRPLPADYEEVVACAVCREPRTERCLCSGPDTLLTQRKDGKPFTAEDLRVLFPERYVTQV